MRSLTLSGLARHRDFGLFVLRILVGAVMFAHGWQKLFDVGPAAFGNTALAGLGVPAPVFMAYVVTIVELVGGAFLILGLLTRLSALLLTVDLIFAILLVKVKIGFLSGLAGVGAELELALIGGFVALFFVGAGRYSVDAGLEQSEAEVWA